MNKIIVVFTLFLSILSVSQSSRADDLDIPLFDDLPPNLGRTSTPLESLSLTPPPLPEVIIPIANEQDSSTEQAQAEVSAPTENLPRLSAPIALPISEKPQSTPLRESTPSDGAVVEKEEINTTPTVVHDVSSFEIANLTLGMTPAEVLSMMRAQNYALVKTQDAIPPFYATDYAQECRDQGVRIPEKLQKCIKQYACDRQTQYVSEATFKRKNEQKGLFLYFKI